MEVLQVTYDIQVTGRWMMTIHSDANRIYIHSFQRYRGPRSWSENFDLMVSPDERSGNRQNNCVTSSGKYEFKLKLYKYNN